MSHWPDLNSQSWPGQYAVHCPGDVNPLQFATVPLLIADQLEAAHTYQLSPTPLVTMIPILSISSPSKTSNQSSSPSPHEEKTPSPSSSTSSKTYTCSICQPHRSYCKPQLLKLVFQLAKLGLNFFKLTNSIPRRHQKTHTKPIACQDPGCNERFAENRDMKRHVSVHHRALVPRQTNFCTESGCKYSREGFGRRDNLLRHLRKVRGLLVRSNDA